MPPPRLLDQVRDRLRVKHYSLRTEDAYLHWIRRFIFYHGKRHPQEMGGPQVDLPWLEGVVRAKRPKHLPVVLTGKTIRAPLE